MRLIDADVLISEIKKDTEKAIEQDDRVGSFWLGYIAGLVIKQPTIQSALDPETLIRTIETGITATNSSDAYSLGMRNGMRWCKSLIDGVEPKFEDDVMSVDDGTDSAELPTVQPERKKGEWLPDNNNAYEMRFVCSCCKESEVVPTIGFTKYRPLWDFCPNCGADMRGEKDG